MRNFWSIFKLQFRNNFLLRWNKKAGSKMWILGIAGIIVLYALVAYGLATLVGNIGLGFASLELQSEFLTLILMCDLICVLLFGIAAILSCLYFSKDNEFYLSLPVKPRVVFAAKIAVVYLVELIVSALFVIPCLAAAGAAMKMGAVFFVLIPIAVLLTPVIPMFLACIIAIPIMYIASFFKNRGVFGSIFVLVLFAAFFIAYYVGFAKLQNIDDASLEIQLESVRHIFVTVSNTMYPLYALSRAMAMTAFAGLSTGAAFICNLLIYLGCVIALGAISLLISSAVYQKGVSAQLESAKKNKTSNVRFKSGSAVKTLMKKEWREIIRTPSFALNCLLGIVICPVVVGFVTFYNKSQAIISGAQTEEELEIFHTVMRYCVLFVIMFLGANLNAGPATSFTREGDKMYMSKIIPVSYKTQIKSKAWLYLILEMIPAVLGIIMVSVAYFDIVFLICSLLFMFVYDFASVHFAMFIDLRRPKLKWVTPNEAMKHNSNYMISTFSMLLISAIMAFVGGAVYLKIFDVLNNAAAMALSWLIMFVMAGAFAALSYGLLYKDCDKRFENLEL